MMRLLCHSYHNHNVENLLGPVYRWWLLFEDVVITSHSSCRMLITAAQWNVGWMTKKSEKVFFGGGTVELLYEVLNSTASVHTGKTHSQIEPSTLPDCPTLQQALCKHFWSLQHVFSWKSRGYSLRSWRKVVYSVACNYNLATWQLVSGARSIDKQPTRCQIPPFIIYSYYFRWCPWVPPHSFPCWWFIKQFNKA